MKTSLVIHGNLDHVYRWAHYRKFGPVIVSTWDDADPAIVQDLRDGGFIVVQNARPPKDHYNHVNMRLFAMNSLEGLMAVDTEYAMLLRADEYYDDLTPILRAPRDKVVTTDVFFRKDSVRKFCAGDHIIRDRTDTLLNALCYMNDRLSEWRHLDSIHRLPARAMGLPEDPSLAGDGDTTLSMEQVVCISILKSRGVNISIKNSRTDVADNYHIVPTKELGSFIVVCNNCASCNNGDPEFLDERYRRFDSRDGEPTTIQDVKDL